MSPSQARARRDPRRVVALGGTPAAPEGSQKHEMLRAIQAAAGNRAARMAASTVRPDLPLRRTPLPNVRTSEVAPASTPAPEARHSPHRPHAEDRRKIGIEKVAANATALAALGGDYGITWPQSIRYTHGARLEGSSWVLTVSDLIGEYSVQARILGHQADIPDASVATAGNYQALVAALNTLGVPGHAHNWYSLKAVRAHESRHATRALQALMDVREAIQARMAQITVPRANLGETQAQAVGRLQTAPGYQAAVTACFGLWDAQFDQLIMNDHNGDGPCEVAERSITVPLRDAIMERAKQQRWIAPPAQVALV